MSRGFQLDPFVPVSWALAIYFILLIGFCWGETQRKLPYLPLRLVAQFIMLTAILALVLRPAYTRDVTRPGLLLLTSGYNGNSVDSLLKAQPDLKIMISPEAQPYRGVAERVSFRQLDQKGTLRFVAGEGVPLSFHQLFDSASFSYLPSVHSPGVIRIQHQTYRINRRNRISGAIRVAGPTRVRLIGPGGIEDSVGFRTGGEYPFDLTFFAKQPGRFVYSMTLTDSAGKTEANGLPVEVESERKLRILFLQQYPGAESRVLKNFLISKGHQLSVRYQLSKNNFRYEFANRPDQDLKKLTEESLRGFDLVISDDEAIHLMSPSEKETLNRSVTEGLGLLTIFHDPSADEFLINLLPMRKDEEALDTIRFLIPGYGSFTQPFVPVQPARTETIQPMTTAADRILTGYRFMGNGKAGFQLLRETYRLSLSGSIEAYATHWSPLLEQIARKEQREFTMKVVTPFPVYENEPVEVQIISSGRHPSLLNGTSKIPLAEDVQTDDVWYGKIWAGVPGWHELTLEGGAASLSYFVSKEGAWKTLRQEEQRKVNKILASFNSGNNSVETEQIQRPISAIIFLIAFLLSAGFLWIAPKL